MPFLSTDFFSITSSSRRWGLSLSHRWRNWDKEKLNKLPQATQLTGSRIRIQTWRLSGSKMKHLFDHFQFASIHGPNIPGSYAILLFTTSDLASITSHIHNWVLFLLWLHPFIPSGVISPLISSSILGTYDLGSSSFSIVSFCLFILFMGFSKQEYWSGLSFPEWRPLH